mmetsp:Transcript_8209/g.23115  ORF Transcript_8209/g.23115 Transcript_8209/m.23115 type:complete len:215 (-) Transcript_8209:20-664(-)
MLPCMRRVLAILALTHGFAPAPAPRGLGSALHMKKPSPALEAGPLPGLSQTNYNVLIGVTALGVSAPALLAATAVLPSMLPAKAPPTKGKPPAQAAKAPVGAAKFKFAEALPTLPKPAAKKAPAPKKAPFSLFGAPKTPAAPPPPPPKNNWLSFGKAAKAPPAEKRPPPAAGAGKTNFVPPALRSAAAASRKKSEEQQRAAEASRKRRNPFIRK